MTHQEVSLKPCPFCGGEAWTNAKPPYADADDLAHCSECGATVHVTLWNERAGPHLLDALETPAAGEGRPPYLSDRFEFAAPGDHQEDAWLLRFCDADQRDCIWTGEDAEREAWAAWDKWAPAWNIYLFRLARLTRRPEVERAHCIRAIREHKPDASFDDSMAGALERNALLENIIDKIEGRGPVAPFRPQASQAQLRAAYIEGMRQGWQGGRAGEDEPDYERNWQASDAIHGQASRAVDREAVLRVLEPCKRMADLADFYVEEACPELTWPQAERRVSEGPLSQTIDADFFRRARELYDTLSKGGQG